LAEEDLVAGKVYLQQQVSRVHSKASKFKMNIAETQSSYKKRTTGIDMAKVSPSLILRSSERDVDNEVIVLPSPFSLFVKGWESSTIKTGYHPFG